MKIIFIISFLSSVHLFSQELSQWVNPYDHYKGSYEDEISCKKMYTTDELRQIKQFPLGYYCCFLNLTLNADSTYTINIESTRKKVDSLSISYFDFQGNYSIDSKGELKLLGDHPFNSDILIIHEYYKRRNWKKHISNRGFSYGFNDQYSWITKIKEQTTRCEGCSLYPGD